MFDFLKKKTVSNIETKAVNVEWTGAISSILNNLPSTNYFPSDSASILNYIRGYSSACITKISTQISTLPYYLYRVEKENSGKYLGKSLKVKDLNISRKINKSFITGDYTLSKIFEHPFINLIEENMKYTTAEFFYIISAYLLSIGNAYIEIVRGPKGQIVDLIPLFSEYMSLKTDKEGNITQYIYQPLVLSLAAKTYLPENIIHIKRLTAGNIIAGRGVLEDCLIDVGMAEESKKYVQSILVNHMNPSSLIICKNVQKNETEALRIKDKFVESFSGYNRGKSAVCFGDISIESVASNMKDNQVIELNEFVKKSICATFSVPIDLLDSSNSNRATAVTAINNFMRFTIFPMADQICQQLTRQLIAKEYDNTFLISYATDEALETDIVEQANLYKTYIDAGIMTKEEVRTKLGLE